MNFLYEEKVDGDAGEENILVTGVPAKRMYSDRTHTYIASLRKMLAGLDDKILIDVYGLRLLPRR